MIVDFKMPIEPFNSMVKNGTAGQQIRKVLEEIRPESVHFTARDGKRGGIMVVDLEDASKLPSISEPLFLVFNATVEFHPCMTPEDLAKSGLDDMGKNYK
jgi:hypothetical protein